MHTEFPPDECLDYDLACLDFDDWFKARADERVQVRQSKADLLKKDHTWAPKYATVNEIFALMNKTDEGDRPFDDRIDPEIEAIDLLEFWNDDA